MKQWMIKFSTVDEPHKTKTWPIIPGYDKCAAEWNFTVLMTRKLGMSKDDFKIVRSQELK